MFKPIPKPISGGLILSCKCPSACLHCIYACSPHWSADWMSEEMLQQIPSQLAGKILPAPYGPGSPSVLTALKPWLTKFDSLFRLLYDY